MLKASEVIAATGATREDFAFTGITTDSRAVQPGELFVALKGGNFDGHDYCAKAVELGAAGVVISHDIEALPAGVAVFKVEDTLKAYQAMARAYRRQQKKLKVFAITGSNGKTSTKDLLAACLGAKYKVVKTQGNFNNEIGLPKTLLSIQPDTDIAVVEMGMRGLGQIARTAPRSSTAALKARRCRRAFSSSANGRASGSSIRAAFPAGALRTLSFRRC